MDELHLKRDLLLLTCVGELSELQSRSLRERLAYVLEFCDKLDAVPITTGRDVAHTLDDIELDFWVNLGTPELEGTVVSSWIIHVDWRTLDRNRPLAQWLPPTAVQRLESTGDLTSLPGLIGWLKLQSSAIRQCASGAFAAEDVDTFAAHIMGMNVLLLNSLSALTRARLTTRWFEPFRSPE